MTPSKLQSVSIPSSVTAIGEAAFENCTSLLNVTIPNGVTNVGDAAFANCQALTYVTIPASVNTIEAGALSDCVGLSGALFLGGPPGVASGVFFEDNYTTVYYLPGTSGWSNTFQGRPASPWNPEIQAMDSGFGVRSNKFGFTITGITNTPVLVEACTNLTNPIWSPLQILRLVNGSYYFSDAKWTNYRS